MCLLIEHFRKFMLKERCFGEIKVSGRQTRENVRKFFENELLTNSPTFRLKCTQGVVYTYVAQIRTVVFFIAETYSKLDCVFSVYGKWLSK